LQARMDRDAFRVVVLDLTTELPFIPNTIPF